MTAREASTHKLTTKGNVGWVRFRRHRLDLARIWSEGYVRSQPDVMFLDVDLFGND
ncbi:MAG: hypothetical protein QW486_04750 [Candidatus Bathyarchaeia archaeon]